ncbi:MAG: NrfD/PsrC family molybdoenzyme membrane anchor subunit [Blastocatellia bacterium]
MQEVIHPGFPQKESLTARPDLVLGGQSHETVTEKISGVIEGKTPLAWYVATLTAAGITGILFAMLGFLVWNGVAVWGNNQPVGWGWDITNFVWWIGIGHAGTLISAILFLFRQKWRTSINRAAEAMTLFAVMCAAIYPGVHVGRAWMAIWLFPIPYPHDVWQNFRSPLMWDVFAVSTYGTVSALFWYVGLIPDLATIRDRAQGKIAKFAYGLFSLGWRGSTKHWRHYEVAYMILAGISTPLVLSVHSIVSFDFATSIVPGWHTTIFPPYFVAGAVFSGFAMVMNLMLIARYVLGLQAFITPVHLDNMNKIMLVTGNIVGFAYLTEFFIAWYSGNPFEKFTFFNRAFGPYAWAYWTMMTCNVISPQLFWFKAIRRSVPVMFVICIIINIGMWFERFVIIATSLHRDFVPSSWGYFRPTLVDILTFTGTLGLFFTMFLLFCRFIPVIAVAEVKAVLAHQDHKGHDHLTHGAH